MSDSVNNCNDILRFSERTLVECTQILCARRAEILKILRFFRATSAQNLREVDAGCAQLAAEGGAPHPLHTGQAQVRQMRML